MKWFTLLKVDFLIKYFYSSKVGVGVESVLYFYFFLATRIYTMTSIQNMNTFCHLLNQKVVTKCSHDLRLKPCVCCASHSLHLWL